MNVIRLIEDLERLQFKLQVEAELTSDEDRGLSKRLSDLALETSDAILAARSLPPISTPTPVMN